MIESSKALYSLRRNFSIIGLTGRMGAGCTDIAEILSSDSDTFFDANDIRKPEDLKIPEKDGFSMNLYKRKYSICYNFLKVNPIKYEVVDYKKVLFLYLFNWMTKNGNNENQFYDIITQLFERSSQDENIFEDLRISKRELEKNIKRQELRSVMDSLMGLTENLLEIKGKGNLGILYKIFFNENSDFNKVCKALFNVLDSKNLYLRTFLLHRLANNIRANGGWDRDSTLQRTTENVYNVALVINRLIKAYKANSKNKDNCHIVINSLKNSVEIMFFKERYSAFYLMMVNNEADYKNELKIRTKGQAKNTFERLEDLDAIEYASKDFSNGIITSPDVENCIQKAEIHVINVKEIESCKENKPLFVSSKEQLVKILALIQQPGIITPSNQERCMLIAYNAKFNSGCLSRQVGAVLTDNEFAIKSVGWNDIPKKSISCLLKNTEELLSNDIHPNDKTYSPFEIIDHPYKYKPKNEEVIPKSGKKEVITINEKFVGENFNQNLKKITPDISKLKAEGKNCSFCFKSMHNKFEGHDNQVHTRSLHAEENAMLQITKYGGQPIYGGKLFTTASPCELCAKKAMQIGVEEIYFIDPYPGISMHHVLKHGDAQPTLVPFKGIIGKSFNKLYEPFMSYKDEMSLYK